YELAVPMLDEFNFKGTFWLVGSRITESSEEDLLLNKKNGRITWPQLRKMAANGHEISNHSWTHAQLPKLSESEVRKEIFKTDSVILKKIGKLPRTFCYPGNGSNKEVIAIAEENRVGSRTFQKGMGRNSTVASLNEWVGGLIQSGEWGVAMIHAITTGYDPFTSPEVLHQHLAYVKQHEDSVWVGTFEQVAAYRKERDDVKLDVKYVKNGLECSSSMTLDKKIYDQPLTLVIGLKGIKQINAVQKSRRMPATIYSDHVCVDFVPGVAAVKIKWK
ncbi:MAG: polysaccharide deacetylase family protein, partial [Bacteroidales bacterium]|nr:polysaccharide deacetylase family protein [Bacteroidales bacterium]